jgi:hypothetical protein
MHLSQLLRRGTAWAMLALYGLVASGIPLPMGLPPAGSAAEKKIAGKDLSRPFPCMDKPCGCATAKQCFTSCCCHTPAETLAWARARGIDESVINALTRRVAAVSAPAAASGGCCSSKAPESEPSCCSSPENEIDQAICSDYQSLAAEPKQSVNEPACEHEAAESNERPAAAVGVLVLRDMLACGGMQSWWASGGVSLPPPAIVRCEFPRPHVATLVLHDVNVPRTGSPPDLPPPRGC